MKKVMSSLFGMMVCTNLCAWDDNPHYIWFDNPHYIWFDNPHDIRVEVSDMPRRVVSEEEKEAQKAYRGLNLQWDNVYSSFGTCCKASSLVAVGRIVSVLEKEIELPPRPRREKKTTTTVDLTLRISETLVGKIQGDKVSFTSGSPFRNSLVFPTSLTLEKPPELPRVPQVFIPGQPPERKPISPDVWIGTEVLVFLTDKLFDYDSGIDFNFYDWFFDRERATGTENVPLQLLWGSWKASMIVLTDSIREEILANAREYIRLQSSRDANSYKAFLTRQIESPIQRFSDDAVWDLIHFMRSYYTDKEDLKKASQSPLLDKRVRGYFEFHRIMETIPKE